MIKDIFKYLIQFVIILLAQLLIFNNIELSGYINPYIYVLFVLLLPFDTPKTVLLLLAFVTGITMDLFMGTPGVHSSALVLMAFARPMVLALFSPREGYQTNTLPRMSQFGFEWFVKYSVMLVLIHHFVLFFLEVFTFQHFFSTLLRSLLSALLTVIILTISQFFIFRK
jgi:rod shape-determining protein MreD